jgi:hypothetical protein
LVLRCGFLPRFLGYWLILNGFAYLFASLISLLVPQFEDTYEKFSFPAYLGEVAFMLWLLIRGLPRAKDLVR